MGGKNESNAILIQMGSKKEDMKLEMNQNYYEPMPNIKSTYIKTN